MAMELGGVLKLLNGNPLKKCNGVGVIGESFPLTKSLDGGAGLGGLMSKMMGAGGLSSIIGNPMAAVTGQLQGAVGAAVGQITGAMGGAAGGLPSALTALSSAAGAVQGAAGGLLTGAGVQDVVGHAGIADMVGPSLPSSLSLETVLGPANAHGLVGDLAAFVPGLAADVISGATSVGAAVAVVEAHTATLTGIVTASSNALTGLANLTPAIAAVSTVAAAVVDAPPALRAVLERAIAPDDLAVMRESVAGHTREDD